MIKFIDAKKDLSVQVHPTDEYAREHEKGQLGKTEMWYVLDAGRDAKLVYGLKRDSSEGEMRKAIANGTLMNYLQQVPVRKDDLFFIEAGYDPCNWCWYAGGRDPGEFESDLSAV